MWTPQTLASVLSYTHKGWPGRYYHDRHTYDFVSESQQTLQNTIIAYINKQPLDNEYSKVVKRIFSKFFMTVFREIQYMHKVETVIKPKTFRYQSIGDVTVKHNIDLWSVDVGRAVFFKTCASRSIKQLSGDIEVLLAAQHLFNKDPERFEVRILVYYFNNDGSTKKAEICFTKEKLEKQMCDIILWAVENKNLPKNPPEGFYGDTNWVPPV